MMVKGCCFSSFFARDSSVFKTYMTNKNSRLHIFSYKVSHTLCFTFTSHVCVCVCVCAVLFQKLLVYFTKSKKLILSILLLNNPISEETQSWSKNTPFWPLGCDGMWYQNSHTCTWSIENIQWSENISTRSNAHKTYERFHFFTP